MKNVTITLEEEVARWARVKAAERDTSMSRFVGELLKARMEEECGSRYQEAMRSYFSRGPQKLGKPGKTLPKREELYDRDVFRRYQRPGVRTRRERT